MERKIGEIFEYKGEWYQCVNGFECTKCDLHRNRCIARYNDIGSCSKYSRVDDTPVIFKKLEKVGEPFFNYQCGKWMQTYKLFEYIDSFIDGYWFKIYFKEPTQYIDIEIKQNKEDMEEKAWTIDEAIKHYDEIGKSSVSQECSKKNHQVRDWLIELKQYYSNSEKIGKDLKPFDIEAAKAGKPVCTRDGRRARIICFDVTRKQPIIALLESEEAGEGVVQIYYKDGSYYGSGLKDNRDLMMLPEKKEGWVNIYNRFGTELICDGRFYFTKEDALSYIDNDGTYVKTIKVEWEE